LETKVEPQPQTAKTHEAPERDMRGREEGQEELPVAGYATLATIFATDMAGLLAALASDHRLPRLWSVRDVLMTGLATSRLARLITRDRVAMALREPFVVSTGSAGAGEVKGRPRGHGLRRAVGSLLTCPFCAAPWVATALLGGLAVRRRATRFIEAMLVSVVIADFVQQLYAVSRRSV